MRHRLKREAAVEEEAAPTAAAKHYPNAWAADPKAAWACHRRSLAVAAAAGTKAEHAAAAAAAAVVEAFHRDQETRRLFP